MSPRSRVYGHLHQGTVSLWRPSLIYANEGQKRVASACVHILNVLYDHKVHSCQRICLYSNLQLLGHFGPLASQLSGVFRGVFRGVEMLFRPGHVLQELNNMTYLLNDED